MLTLTLSIVIVVVLGGSLFFNQTKFGKTPKGERLERIKQSPNFYNGKFQNLNHTPQFTSDGSRFVSMLKLLFNKDKNLRPSEPLPILKPDLHQLDRKEDVMVWFGHSSCFIQVDGKRFLIDPVFIDASPVSFFNKPFKGPDAYKPSDIPEIDYMIITHDHWDHLDYKTVMQLKDRTEKIICGLGVGEHFEYWGFDPERIIELDWNEHDVLAKDFIIHCLPARHFSGRGFKPNQSLWASFLIQTPSQRIYISGDGGYDTHFAEIGQRFYPIDLAIIENGQYNTAWKYIHLMPELMAQTARDLHAKQIMTVHHFKYALSRSPWDEPIENIKRLQTDDLLPVFNPMMGEIIPIHKNKNID